MNPTTQFDHLMKQAFKILFPEGSSNSYLRARHSDDRLEQGANQIP